MIRTITVLAILITCSLASESPYVGKISLRPIEQSDGSDKIEPTIEFTPLTEEPKIANFKHKFIEIIQLAEEDVCKAIPLLEDPDNPFFAVIEIKSKSVKCGLMTQIRNVKKAGYQGFILVTDFSKKILKNHCKMYDDNQFFTGIMDEENYKILNDYEKVGLALTKTFLVKGLLSIQIKDSNLKLVEVWVSSLNKQSYDTLELLKDAIKSIPTIQASVKDQTKEIFQWTPRFATFSCTHGDSARSCAHEYIASCGCKGQFCSPDIREKTPGPMIQEDIRQLFIFNIYGTKYLQYAHLFADECLQKYQKQKLIDECSTKVMQKLGIDSYSISQQVGQFIDKCGDDKDIKKSETYETLARDQRAFQSYGRYPLVLVNKQIIQFNDQLEFNTKLCQKLSINDDECHVVVGKFLQKNTIVSVLFFVLLILVLALAAVGVVYFYRKKLKRDVNKEIKMQVSTAVEHYFALTEANTSK